MANYRRAGLVWFALATVVFLLVAGCKGFFVNPTLTTITVGASNGSSFVNVGATLQMIATGTFNDGSTGTVTATWSSSAIGTASVNATTGLVTGVTPGPATITATSQGISGTASVTVCGDITAITISPLNQSISLGTKTLQFTAKDQGGNDITNSVTWSSTSSSVAAFTSGTSGLASLVGAGTTTIQATSCNVLAQTTLTVTSP
ncbi:MAG: Ig-like domain-containing protein [Terriglobales bacterium]